MVIVMAERDDGAIMRRPASNRRGGRYLPRDRSDADA